MATDRLIITGAFGSGKSTLLQQIRALGGIGIDEPARQILAEQRSIDGNGVPDRNPRLFVELMLSRTIDAYHRMVGSEEPVFFDRGIPDMIAYASIFELDYPPAWNAARRYRYAPQVFFVPAWEQIYTTDEERTVPFEYARGFGETLREIYTQLGYALIDVPCIAPEERARFILDVVRGS